MSVSDIAIRRPVSVTCLFALILIVGAMAISKLGVDLFPNVNFPIIVVTTPYPGAAPTEIESLIAKPIEDSLGALAGIKNLRSISKDGVNIVIVEFSLDTDSKYAEQQVKDRVSSAKRLLPDDALDPDVRAFDISDMPHVSLALTAKKDPADLFDLAEQQVKPLIEQVSDVGMVEIIGGRKREVHVLLNREALYARNLSAAMVAAGINTSGKNIPAGKANSKNIEALVRTLGEFDTLENIRDTVLTFYGNENPVRVSDVATVKEALEDEKTRAFVNGKPALTISVTKRTGANTIKVVEAVKKKVKEINAALAPGNEGFELVLIQEQAKAIWANVEDVSESIIIGIILTIIVVFFFLGSMRSTVITGIALPNSLLGAFILMLVAGFTINTMTLLALSLAVGLLIDDAIVVRENIFRHIEEGESPVTAASIGTREVTLAVLATTFTVIAVFGPVAFLDGVVGQFFKEFGLTICFAMIISLLDALTMAPMLSAYFAGPHRKYEKGKKSLKTKIVDGILYPFNLFQDLLGAGYNRILHVVLRWPAITLLAALAIFVGSFFVLVHVPKNFIPVNDVGEFQVRLRLPASSNLERTSEVTQEAFRRISQNPEIKLTLMTIGGRNGESNESDTFVQLVPFSERKRSSSEVQDAIRQQLKDFDYANPMILDRGSVNGGQQPVIVNIMGPNVDIMRKTAHEIFEKIRHNPNLRDVDINDHDGKPEYRILFDKSKVERFGVSTSAVGQELRTMIEGQKAAVFRRNALEYDIRVRLQEDQRNMKENFSKTFVPNLNYRLVKLSEVATVQEKVGAATIERLNRNRFVQITASLNAEGRGLDESLKQIANVMKSGEVKLPPGVTYTFIGQAENFEEMMTNMLLAAALAVFFIYLVLASLYESFVTPFSIMLVLPLAICGAFYALYLTGSSLDIFSMIGCIMLLGIATKNSILLVDHITQSLQSGMELKEAILESGRIRLRPIFMTTVALIAGMLPVAIGLTEVSKHRTSMGIAVIGGLVSSTILTLLVVPAAYAYLNRFRSFFLGKKI